MRCTLPTKRGLSLNLSLFCLFGLTMVLSTCGTPSTRTAASALPTPRPDPSPSVHATCRTERLRLALDQDVSELGNAGLQLTFENASRESCTLSGYPALQLLDAQHKQLPMKMARSTSGYLYQMHDPQVITLQPGKKAYFVISWANQGCSSETYHVSFLQVTPPDNQTPLLLANEFCAFGNQVSLSPLGANQILGVFIENG
jgi:Protein of unknown function (DUF4232)